MPVRKLLKLVCVLIALGGFATFALRNADPARTLQTAHLPTARPSAPAVLNVDEFGLNVTGLREVNAVIKHGNRLPQMLEALGVAEEQIPALVQAARDSAGLRRLEGQREIRVYALGSAPQFIVYEPNAVDYVVFDLTAEGEVYKRSRTIEVRERTVSGVFNGSLYSSLKANGADASVAGKLAEVFAWQVDFHRIKKNDRFSVVYEEKAVEGKTIDVGRVLAGHITHGGQDFYAVYFEQDGEGAYYDEKGQSLRQAFLKSPLKYSRITSRFSPRRFHPVQKIFKPHLGTDYAAPTGTPILATGDGVVLEAGRGGGNGLYVKIRHNKTYETAYLHMSRIAPGMRRGVQVEQGQVIGYVGSTGLSTGPHVCYRFWKNGVQVDPLRETALAADPITAENRGAFEQLRSRLLPDLIQPVDQPEYAAAVPTPAANRARL